jgi:hypothetical protein
MLIDLHYAVLGSGGKIWWVDKTGGRPWSDVVKYAFNLLPNSPNNNWQSLLTGSFMVSDPFQLSGSQTLTVKAMIATAGFKDNCLNDVGFGVLLEKGKTKDILFALRPDNVYQLGDTGPGVPFMFAKPTQPGGFTPTPYAITPPIVLGGVDYSYRGQGATNVTSGCSPGAGQYQLLFGMFTGDSVVAGQPSALVVWSVDAT